MNQKISPLSRESRFHEWTDVKTGLSRTTNVRAGAEISEHLREYYWQRRDKFADTIAEAARRGARLGEYYMVDRSCKLIGAGRFSADAGPDKMAFLACLFHDVLNCTIALVMPKGLAGNV